LRTGANLAISAGAVIASVATAPKLLFGFAVAAIVCASIEVLRPLAGGRRTRWVKDLTHAIGNRALILPPLLAMVSMLGPVLYRATPADLHRMLSKPNVISLIAVLVVSDLFNYLAHRLLHRVGWLWRLHAVHHSSEHLDWLATSRGHPIDQIVNLTAATLPVIAIGGASYAPALIAFLYLYPFVLHANARLRCRWLGLVFVTPVFHHWHHAHEEAGHDRNFGAILSIWDRMFGTAMNDHCYPAGYGIGDAGLDRQDYLGQLVSPLVPRSVFVRSYRARSSYKGQVPPVTGR
jgi:sterol desaturase/sphingolipid hydroxylase (fatty acid hydroxylase superfamily)